MYRATCMTCSRELVRVRRQDGSHQWRHLQSDESLRTNWHAPAPSGVTAREQRR